MGEVRVEGFLADSVVTVEGKLYVLGAGWNRVNVALFPARHDRIGVGLLLHVEAGSAREARSFELAITGPDGSELALGEGPGGTVRRISGEFTAGGADEQIVPIAVNLNGVPLERPGDYRVIVSVEAREAKTLPFRVQSLATQERSTTGGSGYL